MWTPFAPKGDSWSQSSVDDQARQADARHHAPLATFRGWLLFKTIVY